MGCEQAHMTCDALRIEDGNINPLPKSIHLKTIQMSPMQILVKNGTVSRECKVGFGQKWGNLNLGKHQDVA